MRKLIEITQENGIVCDNKTCDFKIVIETKEFISIEKYVNEPCPKCGENLLTEDDYVNYRILMGIINWMNKWFSWIMIFVPKNKKLTKATIKTHKGFSVDIKK